MYTTMNLLSVLLIFCIVMAEYGTDLIRTPTWNQLQVSPANIKMVSEGKKTISNYVLNSRKNSASKTTFDKNWIRNLFAQKDKGSNEINKNGVNFQNNVTSFFKNVQMSLIRPKLKQCPDGMVRDNRGQCAPKFSDD